MKVGLRMRKFMAMLLSAAMVLSLVTVTIPTASASAAGSVDLSNAMHFIVRHWHRTTSDSYAQEEIEGYIVPNNGLYALYDKDGKVWSPTESEGVSFEGDTVTIKVDPKTNEEFAGFSISAGHGAVDATDNTAMTITYSQYIHLVKSHIFYIIPGDTKIGNGNETLFTDTEKDTVYVYTDSNGDIITDDNGNPIPVGSTLPDGKTADGTPLKIYNSADGLHTDKTAYDTAIARQFEIELEAWFTGARTANVGMILDASGSMAFASDTPTPIKVTDAELLNKMLTSEDQNWEDVFLTLGEVSKLLNPNNTDNSRLGVGGYTYFVYDPRESTVEYTPLAYWKGEDYTVEPGKKDVSVNVLGYYGFNNGSLANGAAGGGTATLVTQSSMSGEFSFDTSASSGAVFTNGWLNVTRSTSGVKLDAVPENGNFTISFKMKIVLQDGNNDSSNDVPVAVDILYVGGSSSVGSSSDFFRVVRRETGSRNRLRASKGMSSAVGNFNDVFNKETEWTVTCVFNADTVTTYIYGDNDFLNDETGGGSAALAGYNIIFGGFDNSSYKGSDILVDDIFVLDQPLSKEGVETLSKGNYQSASQVNLTVDVPNTRVFPSVAKNGENVIGAIDNGGYEEGWYYLTHSSEWGQYTGDGYLTGKRLVGNKDGETVTDNIKSLPDDAKGVTTGGTEKSYKVTGKTVSEWETGLPVETTNGDPAEPVKFYIDGNGYLRCFFYTGSSTNTYCSYVYELADDQYVKTEALQEALGAFVTHLSEKSSGSQVAAVRFSTAGAEENLDKLVLLDWTNDAKESASILSLNRGDGSSTGYTVSKTNNLNQYNYGLTGGTYTNTGLKAYKEQLADSVPTGAAKYLIIFTDGKDDLVKVDNDGKVTSTNTEAQEIAKNLRDAGYTIFTVMLAGGPIKKGADGSTNATYDSAHDFLVSLSGTATTTDADREKYFFYAETAEQLTEAFIKEILPQIEDNLTGYTVEDTIDPRFDLVDTELGILHLNAGGEVYNDSDELVKKVTGTDGIEITTNDGKTATLLYNGTTDMYFLRWTDQEIPGNGVGATRVSIWSSRITVRAKDDFLGGNAVLTNGNAANQNWVYHPDDDDASSGTDDMLREGDDPYPSKGFPRTTVNVSALDSKVEDEQLIYMGEDLSAETVAQTIIDAAKDSATGKPAYYYWEYLERYVEAYNNSSDKSIFKLPNDVTITGDKLTLGDLLKVISGDGSITIPYFYLDDPDGSNQTGTADHRADPIGYLTYSTSLDEDSTAYPDGGTTEDTGKRITNLNVTFTPDSVEDRKEDDAKLVTEKNGDNPVYGWDSDYKSVVGNEIEEDEDAGNGVFTTEIVSGWIVMQMKISEDVFKALQAAMEAGTIGDSVTITYSADLKRTYTNSAGIEVTDTVGTLTGSYTFNKDGGTDAQTVTLELQPTGDYASYIKSYGLPMGDYQLEMNSSTTTGADMLLKFGDISIPDFDASLFEDSKATGSDSAGDYIAPTEDNNKAHLGSDENLDEGEKYTDRRFAQFLVELEPVPTGSVTISKTIDENAKLMGHETTVWNFTVTFSGLNTQADSVIFADSDGVQHTFAKTSEGVYTATIGIQSGKSVTIEGIPVGTQVAVSEEGNSSFDMTVTGSATSNGSSVTIDEEDNKNLTFEYENNYKKGNLTVSKEVAGSTADMNKAFTFTVTLYKDENKTQQATDISGEFGDVTFANGTVTFTLKDGEEKNITDLPAGLYYTVVESDNDGYYVEESNPEGSIPDKGTAVASFKNTMPAPDSLVVDVTKNVTGETPTADTTFRFKLELVSGDPSTDGVTMPGILEIAIAAGTTSNSGSFGAVTFTREGTYVFKVTEVKESARGYTYDETVYTITVVVEIDATGETVKLKSSTTTTSNAENSNNGVEFNNEYKPVPASIEIPVSKTVDYGTASDGLKAALANDKFTFTLTAGTFTPTDGAVMPTEKTELKLKAGEDGKFGEITFSKAGEYIFTVREKNSPIGYSTATSSYTVTVIVGDDGSGNLNVTKVVVGGREYTGNDIGNAVVAFTNTYTLPTPIEVTIEADKSYKDEVGEATLESGMFSFTLKDDEGTELTAQNNANGKVTLTLTYDAPGTYTYTLSEVKGGDANIEYDETVYTVVVTVTLDRDTNEYVTSVTYSKDGTALGENEIPGFENTRISPQLEIVKDQNLTDAEGNLKQDFTTEALYANGGDIITYRLTITNDTEATAYTLTVTDVVPEGLELIESSIEGGSYDDGTKTITWTRDSFSPEDDDWVLTFQVKVPADRDVTTQWTNVAKLTYKDTKESEPEEAAAILLTPDDDGVYTLYTNAVDAFTSALSLTKTVSGTSSSREFKFTATLTVSSDGTLEPLTGTVYYYLMKDGEKTAEDEDGNPLSFDLGENGEAEFTLTHGETIVFTSIAPGTSFTFEEDAASRRGFTASWKGNNSSIAIPERDDDVNDPETSRIVEIDGGVIGAEITCMNRVIPPDMGALVISKTVVVIDEDGALKELTQEDLDREFTFNVTLTPPAGSTLNASYDLGEYGTLTRQLDGSVTGTVKLKHGQSVVIEDLPAGTRYTVTEIDYGDYTPYQTDAEGAIPAEETATAEFVNTRIQPPEPSTGALTVSKTVRGTAGETDREFTFTVTLGDESINGVYGDMEFVNGVAAFTLKHGESKTASGLPAGTAYTVTEADNEGYAVSSTGERGEIPEDSTAECAFINTKDAPEEPPEEPTQPPEDPTEPPEDPTVPTQPEEFDPTPKTGDDSKMGVWIAVMLASLAGMILAIIPLMKRRGKK